MLCLEGLSPLSLAYNPYKYCCSHVSLLMQVACLVLRMIFVVLRERRGASLNQQCLINYQIALTFWIGTHTYLKTLECCGWRVSHKLENAGRVSVFSCQPLQHWELVHPGLWLWANQKANHMSFLLKEHRSTQLTLADRGSTLPN